MVIIGSFMEIYSTFVLLRPVPRKTTSHNARATAGRAPKTGQIDFYAHKIGDCI